MENYSKVATIQEWQLFEGGNYSGMATIEGLKTTRRWQGGISTWSPAVSGLVSLSTFLFTSPLTLLQLSLEVFNVAGVLLPQDLDLLPFILQSHWQLLHYMGTLWTYTVYVHICNVHVRIYVTVPCCYQRLFHCVFCVHSIVALNFH